MATPFQSVYDKFLSYIDDYELALITTEELDDMLEGYLSRAVSLDFKQCKANLNNVDLDIKQFNEELTLEEQWIIATGMTLSWLEPKIKREDLLRAAISDRDYKESSHANQLDKLMELEQLTRRRLKQYIVSYTHNDSDGLY